MEDFIEIGKITNTHGIKGEVKAESWGDEIDQLLDFGFFYIGNNRKVYEVEKARMHGNATIIKFRNVDEIEGAQALKNQVLFMDKSSLEPLKEGEFYTADLVGLRCLLENGETLGTVFDVMKTGANDVLIIRNRDGKEFLVPFIKACIGKVDMTEKTILITPLEGLFET